MPQTFIPEVQGFHFTPHRPGIDHLQVAPNIVFSSIVKKYVSEQLVIPTTQGDFDLFQTAAMSDPPPASLVFLSDLDHLRPRTKVRFLGW
jgi:hypothetical protein